MPAASSGRLSPVLRTPRSGYDRLPDVGRIGRQLTVLSQPERFPDRTWWQDFDPTTLPTCSRCSFLPVCWGGCPKRHLDASRADIDAEGRFWRRNLPRMIAAGLDEQLPGDLEFTAADQFREGIPTRL